MKNYNQLVRELDSSGAHYSQELSEVDVSDPEDVKVLAADSNGEVLVHLGAGNYLQRYKTYVTHAQHVAAAFDKLESVDLRYDGQIIVNPDLNGDGSGQPALTPTAAKAAMAAGVKTAALGIREYVAHPAGRRSRRRQRREARRKGPRAKVAVHMLPRETRGRASRRGRPSRRRQTTPVKQAPLQANCAEVERSAARRCAKVAAPPAVRFAPRVCRGCVGTDTKPSAAIRKEFPQSSGHRQYYAERLIMPES